MQKRIEKKTYIQGVKEKNVLNPHCKDEYNNKSSSTASF